MTENEFAQQFKQAFQVSKLDICFASQNSIDIECDVREDVFIQIYADREENVRIPIYCIDEKEIKILTTKDIATFLGLVFAAIAKEHDYKTALKWANTVSLEDIYEWHNTAINIFNGKIRLVV